MVAALQFGAAGHNHDPDQPKPRCIHIAPGPEAGDDILFRNTTTLYRKEQPHVFLN
jgi:hypothetical protein